MSDLLASTQLEWIRHNPKIADTAAHVRFDVYRGSASVEEFYSRGGCRNDLKHDMKKGYVWVKKRPACDGVCDTDARAAQNSRASFSERQKLAIKEKMSKKRKQVTGNIASSPHSSSSKTDKKREREESDIEEQPNKKIACIGDSNTTSRGKASYPQLLQSLLDTRGGQGSYTVRSFGVSGACAAATHGKKHYSSLVKFAEAKAFKADIYVIMLGTNDAWHAWGEPLRAAPGISELVQSLVAESLSAGSREPSILIVLPPGAKPGSLVGNLKNVIHPAIVRLASGETNVKALDPKLFGKEWYKSDLVHLNYKGATKIAELLAVAIRKIHATP